MDGKWYNKREKKGVQISDRRHSREVRSVKKKSYVEELKDSSVEKGPRNRVLC